MQKAFCVSRDMAATGLGLLLFIHSRCHSFLMLSVADLFSINLILMYNCWQNSGQTELMFLIICHTTNINWAYRSVFAVAGEFHIFQTCLTSVPDVVLSKISIYIWRTCGKVMLSKTQDRSSLGCMQFFKTILMSLNDVINCLFSLTAVLLFCAS